MPSGCFLNKSQVAIGLRASLPLDAPNNKTVWRRDPRIAPYLNTESQRQAGREATNDVLKTILRDAVAEPETITTDTFVTLLTHEIGCIVFGLMLKNEDDLDIQMSLTTLGLDSLVSIELRNWIKRALVVRSYDPGNFQV